MMTETQFIKSVTPSWDDYFMEMLPLVARRSKDPNTKVGAIIVGHDNAIRTTGYNGLCSFIDDSRPERWSREGGEKYFWCEHAERSPRRISCEIARAARLMASSAWVRPGSTVCMQCCVSVSAGAAAA